nr:hypothetical protein [uncultured Caproiciproducens sp.]
MHKIIKYFMLIVLLILTFSVQAFAAGKTTEINQLIENAKALDGKEVTVQGEAIGEPLPRGEYCWININDGTNAIGIWMKASDAQKITLFGNYKNKGDVIRVTGIFNRACTEHGGEADIHNNTMFIVQKGIPVKEQIPIVKIITAAFLLFAALSALFAIYHFKILKRTSDS